MISLVSTLIVKISESLLRMPENAISLPSGEKSGDSGASIVLSATRTSIFRVITFWTMSERSFSVRTK